MCILYSVTISLSNSCWETGCLSLVWSLDNYIVSWDSWVLTVHYSLFTVYRAGPGGFKSQYKCFLRQRMGVWQKCYHDYEKKNFPEIHISLFFYPQIIKKKYTTLFSLPQYTLYCITPPNQRPWLLLVLLKEYTQRRMNDLYFMLRAFCIHILQISIYNL